MTVSAHVLSLFVNDRLIKSILPPTTMPAATSKELSALQGKLTDLENTVASLAKASKTPITPSPPASKPAQPSATHSMTAVSPPTYEELRPLPFNAQALLWEQLPTRGRRAQGQALQTSVPPLIGP